MSLERLYMEYYPRPVHCYFFALFRYWIQGISTIAKAREIVKH